MQHSPHNPPRPKPRIPLQNSPGAPRHPDPRWTAPTCCCKFPLFSSYAAIRAKISSEKVVPASANPADTQKMIRYEIKQIKVHGDRPGHLPPWAVRRSGVCDLGGVGLVGEAAWLSGVGVQMLKCRG